MRVLHAPPAHCLTWIYVRFVLFCPHFQCEAYDVVIGPSDSDVDYFCIHSYTVMIHVCRFVWLCLMYILLVASSYCFVCWFLFLLIPSLIVLQKFLLTIPSCSSLLCILCCLVFVLYQRFPFVSHSWPFSHLLSWD